MSDDESRLTRLEERYTHLHEHVAEQDRVILGLTEDLERLRRELAHLRRERAEPTPGGEDMPANERPPHY